MLQLTKIFRRLFDQHWLLNSSDRELRTKRILEARERISASLFDYQRIGYNHCRPMAFLKIGFISQGAGFYEVLWDVYENKKKKLVLEIFSYTAITCRLIEDDDRVWRGKWLIREKMDVTLSPIVALTTKKMLVKKHKNEETLTDIDVAICTIVRPETYVHTMITSLRPDLPLRLVVGSPDCTYLDRYRSNALLEIIEASVPEWTTFKECCIQQRASWNYWRTLLLGSRSNFNKGLLVLEDDVSPATNWERRLNETLTQIESDYGGLYVLALFTSSIKTSSLPKNSYYAPYPIDSFYGTQAMYYPETVRKGYADYLKKNGVDSYKMPYDILLRDYLREENIPLFTTYPSLFEHWGKITTGLGGFHQARYFKKKV